jgi:hypothetical protein
MKEPYLMTTRKERNEQGPKRRPTVHLGSTLDKTLLAYAAAASAAGVGILALTSYAEAKIVYTPDHKQLPINKSWYLDLNHDGIVDFTFNDTSGTYATFTAWGILTIFPNRSANAIRGQSSRGLRYASAVASGVQVGPKGQFSPGERIMASSFINGGANKAASCMKGPWKNATNRYLGLSFIIKGKTHFGWARLNVSCSGPTVNATLTGYAYETVPEKPIITGKIKAAEIDSVVHRPHPRSPIAPAPKPAASLGLLAIGCARTLHLLP